MLTATTALVVWKEITTNDLASIVLSVSGSTITTPGVKDTVADTVSGIDFRVCTLTSTKALVVYDGTNDYSAVVFDISGTTITSGAIQVVRNIGGTLISNVAAIDSTSAIAFSVSSGSVFAVLITVSGTTVTVEDTVYSTSVADSIASLPDIIKLTATEYLASYKVANATMNFDLITRDGSSISIASAGLATHNRGSFRYSCVIDEGSVLIPYHDGIDSVVTIVRISK